MFVAVESVNIPKKFDTEEAIKNAMDKLEQSYHEIIQPDESQISGN